ncbi:MAG TPA: hypothetical protein VFZ36_02460 [Vicinamibacterales bacterium]
MRHHAGIILPRILSFHAGYRCRNSGACCSAGWVDPRADGVCRHFDAHPSGGCTIQRAGGHAAIPRACQQFPRVVTQSPLGTSVTLSAFCPTAASLLFDEGPFHITALADDRPLEGLDARHVLPPLLRPGMLMDWEAVAAWEQLAVGTLSDHRDDVDRALDVIEIASERVCAAWTPGGESLATTLASAFTEAAGISAAPRGTLGGAFARALTESGMSPASPGHGRAKERSRLRSFNGAADDMPDSRARSEPLARFLAAHAFACWPMYEGRGIRGALDWLVKVQTALDEERRSCADLKEAFRRADLALRHGV